MGSIANDTNECERAVQAEDERRKIGSSIFRIEQFDKEQ